MSDVDDNGGRGEQRHCTGDAADNKDNVVRDMDATAIARDIAGAALVMIKYQSTEGGIPGGCLGQGAG